MPVRFGGWQSKGSVLTSWCSVGSHSFLALEAPSLQERSQSQLSAATISEGCGEADVECWFPPPRKRINLARHTWASENSCCPKRSSTACNCQVLSPAPATEEQPLTVSEARTSFQGLLGVVLSLKRDQPLAWPGCLEDASAKEVSCPRAVFFKLWVVKSIWSVTKINS